MSAPEEQPGGVCVAWGAASDTGIRRALNEDSFLAQSPVFVVADGMGGHEAGEVASAEAIAALEPLVGQRSASGEQVRQCLGDAQRRVRAIETQQGSDAGTTVTGVVLTEQDGVAYWLVLNLGDSRTYRLAGGELEQVSVDHSEVQELVEEGTITREQAASDPRRHVVTRALGAGTEHEADFWMLPIAEHDRILVCSDGLTGELPDERIAEILLGEASPQAAADLLQAAALLAGGRDNVTVLVVDATSVPGARDDGTVPRDLAEDDNEDTIPRVHSVAAGRN